MDIEPCFSCGGEQVSGEYHRLNGHRYSCVCGASGPFYRTQDQALAEWNRVAGQRWRTDNPPPNESVLINVPDAEHYGPGIYRAIRVVDMSSGLGLPPRWHTTAVAMGRDIQDDRVKGWRPLPEPPKGETDGY